MVYFETRETSTVMGVKYTFPLRIIRFQVEKFLLLSFLNPNLRLTYFAAGVKPPIGILTFSSLQMRNLKKKESDTSFLGGSEGKSSAGSEGNPHSIPGSGRSPGEGNGNPLQYSCLKNPMDGGAW